MDSVGNEFGCSAHSRFHSSTNSISIHLSPIKGFWKKRGRTEYCMQPSGNVFLKRSLK